ncbi:MAG: hypothetical protein HFE44_02505 [Oscillospiraceae bacterium]|jgi:hypothetical protein|nr:hypothetical protein [Oscillospiraceae bacterium]
MEKRFNISFKQFRILPPEASPAVFTYRMPFLGRFISLKNDIFPFCGVFSKDAFQKERTPINPK